MHCRNSRLHVINPIRAITLSNIYCIPLSVARETNEELDKRPHTSMGVLRVSETVASEAGEKSCYSRLDHEGLYNVLTH